MYEFIQRFLKPYKYWVAGFICFSMLSGLGDIFNAVLLKIFIDSINNNESLLWPAILYLINLEGHDLTWRALMYINYKIQAEIKSDIISNAFGYICQQPHQYFQNTFAGKISSNVNILATSLERTLHEISLHIIRGLVLILGSLAAMYWVNPIFCLGLSLWILAFCAISLFFARRVVHLSDQYAESESDISGVLVDAVSNSQNIRLFAHINYESGFLAKSLRKMQHKFKARQWFLLKLNLCQGFSITALLAFMIYTLITLKRRSMVTAGDFALIMSLSIELSWVLWWVMDQVNALVDNIGRAKQSLRKLYIPTAIKNKPNAANLIVTNGRIEFDKVHFKYDSTDPLFQNKSIVIEPGQKVGLVGYSGGGKTTFVNLILRLYDINDGSIKIDGQDIRDVTLESLHRSIGMIPQDPSLFHRTLIENIRYGNLNASDEQVIKAAKKAHAHEFISELPEQYNALVGERGVKLSGGQRQRVAIARAMLKNAPILILDEATSQLDSITERKIQESLWYLMQNKTSIVIAHRLSTLLNMDRILVFSHGKIVADGTHEDLLQKSELYKTLWENQVGGFLIDHK